MMTMITVITNIERGMTCWAFWQNWLMVSNMASTLRPAAPMARWSGWVMSATTSTAWGSGRASSGGRLRALYRSLMPVQMDSSTRLLACTGDNTLFNPCQRQGTGKGFVKYRGRVGISGWDTRNGMDA